MNTIRVTDYNPQWPDHFDAISSFVWPHAAELAISIEHVGSTSVTGLAAKPIIDIDIIIVSRAVLPSIISALSAIGYTHLGDLGIADRDAFSHPADLPDHNLYVCLAGSLPLRNHMELRDALRANPAAALAYGELKKGLAKKYPADIDAYIDGKTDFILDLLKNSTFSDADLLKIAGVNKI